MDNKVIQEVKVAFCAKHPHLCVGALISGTLATGRLLANIQMFDDLKDDRLSGLIDGYLRGKVTADELIANGIDPDKLPPQGVYNESLHENSTTSKVLNWIKNNQLKVSGAINVGIGYFGLSC